MSMPFNLFSYLFEANTCLIVFYLFFRALLQKETFFAANRLYIIGTAVFSLALPLIEVPLLSGVTNLPHTPQLPSLTIFAVEQTLIPTQIPAATAPKVSNSTPVDYLYFLYLSSCTLLLARLLWQITRLLHFAQGHSKSRHSGYWLIHTNGRLPTCSFFYLLFWDNTREISADKQALIKEHELAHIRQWHSADAMLLELLKIVCWFNPVVYLLKKAREEVHEYLADAVVTQQHDARHYSRVMAEQVFQTMNFAFIQSFNRSLINKRIAMIETNKIYKPAFWKMALSLPLFAFLFFMYSCRTGEIVPTDTLQARRGEMYRMGEVVVVGYGVPAAPPRVKELHLKFNKYSLPVPLHKLEQVVYESVDEAPSPSNGMAHFQGTIREAVNSGAAKYNGTILIQAIIDEAGNMVKPFLVRGIDRESHAKVLVALEKSPKWTPGKIKGNPVASKVSIAVALGKSSTPYTALSELEQLSITPVAGQPLPQEGMEAFYKHIQKNLQYPTEARRNLISGQVVVGFTIQKDGRLANLEVIESLFPDLDAEVIRVVHQSSLLWKPAMENRQAKESRIVLPVTFKLG